MAAKTVPPHGGETEFASLVAACAALPEARRRELEGLTVEHTLAQSRRHLLPQQGREGRVGPEPESKEGSFLQFPPARHPLLRRLPETGATALHVGSFSESVVGKGEAEGRALIEELLAHATQPCFVHRHRWRAGDLVVYVQEPLLPSGLCAETVGRLVRKVFRE